MNTRVKILTWERVSLVVPEKQDAEIWQRWLNNPEIQSYLWVIFGSIISKEREETYYEKLNKDNSQLTFSIYIEEIDKIIWNISLMKIDYRNMHTELGIAITDLENQDKWYGTESIKLILKYAFEILGLKKVYLKLIDTNTRAKKSMKK